MAKEGALEGKDERGEKGKGRGGGWRNWERINKERRGRVIGGRKV